MYYENLSLNKKKTRNFIECFKKRVKVHSHRTTS